MYQCLDLSIISFTHFSEDSLEDAGNAMTGFTADQLFLSGHLFKNLIQKLLKNIRLKVIADDLRVGFVILLQNFIPKGGRAYTPHFLSERA